MSRTLAQRIHNPQNRGCGCAPDCWCRRSRLGRAVRWYFPGRLVGLHHEPSGDAEWKRAQLER